MQKTPIKSSIPTLRPGDIIANLACSECAERQILVLERHQTDCSFDFSMRGDTPSIVKDKTGPFRWNADRNMFVDKDGRLYDHISREAVVFQGAGMTELQWYRDLPKPDEVAFLIGMHGLTSKISQAQLAKLKAVVGRSIAGGAAQALNGMQQAVAFVLSDSQLTDEQMRGLLIVINLFVAETVQAFEERSLIDTLDGAFSALFRSMGGGDFDDDMDFGQRGPARRERRTAHAG